MLKCVVVDPAFTWARDRRPTIPWDQTIIYVLHVKGFTKRNSKVPEPFVAASRAARKEIIDYIRSLGVTSVELLPVHSFVNDSLLLDRDTTPSDSSQRIRAT
jgi:glycogen operon protein